MTKIEITQINPRVTLITEEMDWVKSASLGFIVASGSRYENRGNNGITHMAEHMLFKGTSKYSAHDIARITEGLGASIDGFTGKEMSGIYFHFLASSFDQILKLFFEIMRNASFDAQELEKEKNVVLQEITEAHDDPKDRLHELCSQIMFPNHPLSFPIAGTPATINSFTSDGLKKLHYNNSLNRRLCISVAGNIKHADVLEKILSMNMQCADIDYWAPPVPPAQGIERSIIFESRPDINQIHTLVVVPTIPFTDERRYGLTILNNIFGGSPSSRIYQRLHEQEALLNYVYTFIDLYSDVGLWCGYHISDKKNREISLRVGFEEMEKLKQSGITQAEFERSINYCKGMIALAIENPMTRMTRNAQKYLFLKKVIPIEESIAIYDRLTLDQINSLVVLFNFEQYSAAIVGPIKREDLGRIGIAPEKIIESHSFETGLNK